jgi:hypothetical protein
MKINLVTVTGADDSTPVESLLAIAEKFPFVEFGILLSRGSMGRMRFPSTEWLNNLVTLAGERRLNLSGHLCGAWVRELLVGKWPESELRAIHPEFTNADIFKRWQINTHGHPHKSKLPELCAIVNELSKRGQTVIFQNDKVNTATIAGVDTAGCENIATLFDLSHGAGVLPENWPAPVPGIYCGYAGGLSPANVADQLKKLEPIVGDTAIWIDAETHLRTPDDTIFSLDKVHDFLTAAAPWCAK